MSLLFLCSCLARSCLQHCPWTSQRKMVLLCIQFLPLHVLLNPFSRWDSCGLELPLASCTLLMKLQELLRNLSLPSEEYNEMGWWESLHLLSRHFSETSFLSTLGENWLPNPRNASHVIWKTVSSWSVLTPQEKKPAAVLPLEQKPQTIPGFSVRERILHFIDLLLSYWLSFLSFSSRD